VGLANGLTLAVSALLVAGSSQPAVGGSFCTALPAS